MPFRSTATSPLMTAAEIAAQEEQQRQQALSPTAPAAGPAPGTSLQPPPEPEPPPPDTTIPPAPQPGSYTEQPQEEIPVYIPPQEPPSAQPTAPVPAPPPPTGMFGMDELSQPFAPAPQPSPPPPPVQPTPTTEPAPPQQFAPPPEGPTAARAPVYNPVPTAPEQLAPPQLVQAPPPPTPPMTTPELSPFAPQQLASESPLGPAPGGEGIGLAPLGGPSPLEEAAQDIATSDLIGLTEPGEPASGGLGLAGGGLAPTEEEPGQSMPGGPMQTIGGSAPGGFGTLPEHEPGETPEYDPMPGLAPGTGGGEDVDVTRDPYAPPGGYPEAPGGDIGTIEDWINDGDSGGSTMDPMDPTPGAEPRPDDEQPVMTREEVRRTGDLPGEVEQTWDAVFGEGADFGPTGELMDEQRDEALRQGKEMMASRGMLNTGAAGALHSDIIRAAARDKAQAHQDWRQTQIQNKLSAASMMFQDSWKNLDHRQQEAMAGLMLEIERRRKYGEGYDPEMGDYEMQLLMELATSDNLDPQGKQLLNEMLSQLFPDMFTGAPSGWEPPGPGEENTKTGDDGQVYTWDEEEGRWLSPIEYLEKHGPGAPEPGTT